MIKKIQQRLLTSMVLSIFLNCSSYQSALNSKDPDIQYELGKEYYDQKVYGKARILLESVLGHYRGKKESRDILLMLIYSCHSLKEHLAVVEYVNDFQKIFFNDEELEQLLYLKGKSLYVMSPRSSLDQTITLDALDVFDDFISRFERSSKVPEINNMAQELTKKLEKKDKDIVKLFRKIEKYKACIKVAENFLINHPASDFREEVSFMKCSCLYMLGIKSSPSKKKIRLEAAEVYYQQFYKKYPVSRYLEDLERLKKRI